MKKQNQKNPVEKITSLKSITSSPNFDFKDILCHKCLMFNEIESSSSCNHSTTCSGIHFHNSCKVEKDDNVNTATSNIIQNSHFVTSKPNPPLNTIFRTTFSYNNDVTKLNELNNHFQLQEHFQMKNSINRIAGVPSLQQTRKYIMNIRNMIVPFLLDENYASNINYLDSTHTKLIKKKCKPMKKDDFILDKNKSIKYKLQKNTSEGNVHKADQASPCLVNIKEILCGNNERLSEIPCPPPIRTYDGIKVTMIDDERKIFIIDLLNERTCRLIRSIAEEYIEKLEKSRGKGNENDNGNENENKGWRTLYTYTKMDLPCSEIKGLAENVTNCIMENIVNIVGEVYGKKIEASNLRPRSWKEPHLLKYQKYDGVM